MKKARFLGNIMAISSTLGDAKTHYFDHRWAQKSTTPFTRAISFNASPSSAAFMRQWIGSSLVQIMACRLLGSMPLYEPMLEYYGDPWELQWKLNRNLYILIYKNAFEIVVWKTTTILSRAQCATIMHSTVCLNGGIHGNCRDMFVYCIQNKN